MSLQFADSFDTYADVQRFGKWSLSFNGGGHITASGRNSQGFHGVDGGMVVQLTPSNAWGTGFAVKLDDAIIPSSYLYAVSNAGVAYCGLNINPDRTISIQGGEGTVLGTSTVALFSGVWYYIEVYIETGGVVTGPLTIKGRLLINGHEEIPLTGPKNTAFGVSGLPGSSNKTYEHRIAAVGPFGGITFDDFYTNNDLGTGTFYGDVHVLPLYPAANSTPQQWGGGFGSINEHPPDDDVSTITDALAGDKSIFVFQTLTIVGAVPWLFFSAWCASDDGTSFRFTVGPDPPALQSQQIFPLVGFSYNCGAAGVSFFATAVNEAGQPWTVARFNSDFFGVIKN